jgi:hypothetical protein
MKAASLILYASLPGREPALHATPIVSRGRVVCYVRVEESLSNFEDSLDEAKPRRGEVVLNTIPSEP